MRRVILLALLALALPAAAFANSIDYTNHGGTVAGNATAGLTVTSTLTDIDANGVKTQGADLGMVTITTGGATAGNLMTGTTTLGPGTITITGPMPFTASFTSATWILNPVQGNGNNSYTLTASFSNGVTSQLVVGVGKNLFSGSAQIASGDTFINTVPEPGTLGLLGTGLVGIAGLVRRKVKSL